MLQYLPQTPTLLNFDDSVYLRQLADQIVIGALSIFPGVKHLEKIIGLLEHPPPLTTVHPTGNERRAKSAQRFVGFAIHQNSCLLNFDPVRCAQTAAKTD